MALSTQTDNQPGSPPQAPLPQISLPKGGGAIQGIGEKFSTNAMTGTGSLTVPIATSKARSGFGPALALSYDSGGGNGVFGVGWRLTLPHIMRKTDNGLPRYNDGDESDVFILSGSDDLVPLLRQRPDGEWERPDEERDGFRIRFYRPRIEGLFARIERWTRICDGEIHWRSFTEDNVLTVYGDSAETRISDPNRRRHVFEWLISRSYDGRGNAIHYEYAAENLRGVDQAKPSERRRAPPSNRYPKRIWYGNRTPLQYGDDRGGERAGWMFEVVFDFGDEAYRHERRSDGETYVEPEAGARWWTVRRDPFSTYRSGFDIRTYRLCRGALIFHRFPVELGVARYLVRSTEFAYEEKTIGSFLTVAVQSGYTRSPDGAYLKKSLPPLAFRYTPSPLEAETPDPFELRDAEAANLPEGIDGRDYRWVDLDGEGISGALSEQGSGWYYKRNLGGGRFCASRLIARKPATARLGSADQQILDVAGDGGLDLVDLAPGTAGFYERIHVRGDEAGLDAGWGRFRPFREQPVVDWRSADLRFVDVTGDGIADILITEDVAFRWHPSLREAGFGAPVRVPAPLDEESGPRVVFSDPSQTVYLADMSGDGLSDILRIRNGEVCYWPNLGYGRFGPKILMDRSPWFDAPGLFDNRRIRLADTDGSGTTDILYLTGEEIYVYLNESGNALSERKILQGLPAPESDAISVVDFLGHGTACLVWSSSLRSNQLRPLRFIDLMRGKKPHLLTHMSNNLGAETAIDYASSTEFYLADRAAGHPWLTRLPFPVHVVKRVESFDSVSHHRFVSTMSYHHGYYDGVEREFRGFGRVERVDTEDGGDRRFPAGTNDDMAWRLSPVLTKTWYHTGAFLGVDRVSRHLAEEYYRAPGETAEIGLESTVFPRGLTPEEAREACRSLKGLQLRQEVYALDTSEAASRPYTVSEGNATIRLFQPRALNRHCVVFSHARESRTLNYERRLYRVGDELRADPRLTQSVNLAVDDYGNVLTSADLAYGRQLPDPSQLLSDADRARQATLLATTMENIYTNAVHTPEAYRTPALAEARTYELVHFDSGSPAYPLRFEDIRRLVAQAGDGHRDLPFEDTAGTETTGPGPYRRLFKASRNLFRADDLARLLPLGELEALALPGESYSLALTPGLITQVYGDKLQDAVLALHRDGGYAVQADGSWWAPSGRVFYSPDAHDDAAAELAYARRHFFLPFRYRDAFGNVTHVQYDAHDLTVLETRDPLGNIVRGRFDYRALQLGELTDPNGNRSTAAFDALARVAGTALMGKPAEGVGDSLEGFAADLPERVVLEHLTEPLKDPDAILGNATTRFIYDPFAFDRTQCEAQPQPATIYAMARETHISDLAPGERSKIQHAFSYSDGFGREVQKKLQAEPGPIPERGIAEASPRWVGTGWTIFNNKGKPVRQYEPFFSATHHFQFNAAVGVASTVIYDPVGREVAMLNPNHTFRKTIFGPWRQETWDVNDTVLIDLAGDPDIAPLIRSLPAEDYRPTWYEQRVGGELGAAEREAAHKAAMHAGTPTVAFADPLGRAFLTVAHNRLPRGAAIVDEFYASRSTLDIQGDERALTDALGRVVMTYDYDVARRKIHRSSTDSGERWTLSDIAGKPLMRFDSRRHRLRNEYDALRRATALYVRTGDGAEKLAERAEYGEQQPEAEAQNLRGKLYRQFDGAGVVVTPSYDFKGNLLRSSRQILAEYREQVDWNAAPRLESEVFASATSYDALNRPVTMTAPDQSVISPQYNDANLLQRLDVSLKGSSAFAAFVTNIEYDAKGQRQLIEYGNGARTVSTHDPLTFRLVHLKTTRRADGADLQDLRYAYDPVGNITSIADSAQQTVYFNNQVVSARGDYRYDAVYRLIEAEGREHAGAPGRPDTTPDDAGRVHLPLPGDGQAMHNYRERYLYDAVGNILELVHTASDRGNWRRHYRYEQIATNNRLTATSVGELTGRYAYDPDGNMTRMPHLPEMRWDFRDQLAATRTQEVGDGRSAPTTFYVYDSGGHRARKVTVDDDGRRRGDRIYLSGFEMYREYGGDDAVTLERTTLHVVDNERRIAIIDTRDDVATVRYQFANQLGSACLELDKDAAIITYEEYYPYGSTSYQSGRSVAETSLKRYRYIGKERDEETGFSYYGARYYASWLGRWTSADPSGAEDGPNLFQYVSGNPVNNVDTQGNWDISLTDVAIGALTAVVVVGAIALTAGVAAPAIAAGLTAVGVSAETITTLGTVAVAAGTSAGIVGTADTAAEVFTGVDPSTGKTISDQQRSRALGALPVQLLASAIGIRGISSGGGPTGGTSFAPAGGPGSWGNGISIPILNAEPALVGLSLGAAATPAVVNALPPNASAMSAYGDDGDSAASRAAREDRPISRARAEEELREALVNETLTPRQREIIQLIEDEYGKDAIAEFRAGGKLPQGVENSHPYSIQTAPELGRQPGDLVPKSFHRFGVHPGDTNIPLNGDPLAPDYAENSGFLIYDEGGPTYDENGDLIGDQAGTDYLDEYGDDDHDLVCRQRR